MFSSIKPRNFIVAISVVLASVVLGLNSSKSDGECQTNSDGECLLQQAAPSLGQEVRSVKQEDSVAIDLGVPQNVVGARADEIQAWIDKSMAYMRDVVYTEPKYTEIKTHCKNQHEDCAFWALLGECTNNPAYMVVNCAPSCQSCDKLMFESRCPLDKDAIREQNVWKPGDLNRMFERIVTNEEYKQFKPKILSRPEPDKNCLSPRAAPHKDEESAAGQVERQEEAEDDYHIGPWAVMFEEFATPEECERLIELGAEEGYERSSDVGERKFDGTYDNFVNNGRTSMNSWCQNECYKDPLARNVMDRISNLTGIPELNSEYLQMLKYEENQYYHTHSDYIPHQLDRQSGVRLLTVYIYLNDVEEGGGTEFPMLGMTVTPKRGRAVIWPSVLDEDPDKKDGRTIHEAKPVIKGVKYGANAWIHMRDFKTPNEEGCT